MQVIKTKSGLRYREKIYIDRKAIYSPRFQRKTDAKEWKARLMSERQTYLATGKKVDLVEEKNLRAPSFKSYSLEWVENRVKTRNSRRTYQAYKSNLQIHLIPFLKNRPLDQITMQDADRLCRVLADKGHSPKGINLIFGVFKRVLIEATREGIIEKNPLAYYKDLKERPRPDVFLTETEIKQLLKSSYGSSFYTLLLVAINKGFKNVLGLLASFAFTI